MVFTKEQTEELLELIDYHHLVFIGENIGGDILTKRDKQLLGEYGFDLNSLGKEGYIETAYKFGMLSHAMDNKKAKKMRFSELKNYLVKGDWVPLTDFEKESLEIIKTHTYSDIKGLGTRYSKKFGQLIIDTDKKARSDYEKLIEKKADEILRNRDSVKDLV